MYDFSDYLYWLNFNDVKGGARICAP